MPAKIDIASAPHLTGARYPMPHDEPCAARERWRLGDAAGLTQFGVNLLRLPAETPAPPVQAKRLPPEKSKGKAATSSDTLIDRYDFGAQINALQDTNALQQGSPTVRPMMSLPSALS